MHISAVSFSFLVVMKFCMFFCLQRVLDHDRLSRNDFLGSVSFTSMELETIVTNFQVSERTCLNDYVSRKWVLGNL